MPCNDWRSLLQRYRASVKAYNEAVEALAPIPGGEFNQLWHQAEVARTEVGVARAALLHHEHKHGCTTNQRGDREEVFQPTEEWVLGDQGQSGG